MQVDGNVSLAAAAGYLSHLLGHEIPESVAFFSQTELMGSLNGDNMTLAGWQKALDEGITTIVLRKSQVCGPSYKAEYLIVKLFIITSHICNAL
jgi:hypothetical protein